MKKRGSTAPEPENKQRLWGIITPATPIITPIRSPITSTPKTKIPENKKPSVDDSLDSQEKMMQDVLEMMESDESMNLDVNDETEDETESDFGEKLQRNLKEMADMTDCHGFKFLAHERTTFHKLFWIFVILGCLAACIVFLYLAYHKYLKAPIVMKFDIRSNSLSETPFPAITFCPEEKSAKPNIFRFSEIHNRYRKEGYAKMSKDDFERYKYFYMICDHEHHNIPEFRKYPTMNERSFFGVLTEFGLTTNQTTFRCTMARKKFNCNDLLTPIYTQFGICFSFNLLHWKHIFSNQTRHYSPFFEGFFTTNEWNVENGYIDKDITAYPFRAYKSGVANGVTIVLKRHKAINDNVCSAGMHGFRVAVHDPMEVPDLTKYHIIVDMNQSVMIQLLPNYLSITPYAKTVAISRRHCYLPGERFLKYYQNYTRHNCLTECLSNHTVEECQCAPFYLPRDSKTDICGPGKQTCCTTAKNEFDRMIFEATVNKDKDEYLYLNCDCKPLCMGLTYSVNDISTSIWRWESYFHSLPESKHEKIEDIELARVSVYFAQDSCPRLLRHEVFGWFDLIANYGALLNLFLGASLLSALQIIYHFTIRMCTNKFIYGSWAGPPEPIFNRDQ